MPAPAFTSANTHNIGEMKVSSEFSRNWKTDCLWFLPVSFWLTVSRIPVVLFGVIAFAAALVQLAVGFFLVRMVS